MLKAIGELIIHTARRTIGSFMLLCALIVSSFATGAMASKPINVVATVGMVADAVKAVGGEQVSVTAIIGTGVDPHSYRQTRSDVVKLGKAEAIFANGLFLEAQLEGLLLKLKAKKPVYFIGEQVPVAKRISSPTYKNRFDPHIWMSPSIWKNAVHGVTKALIDLRPEQAAYFNANEQAYLQTIDQLVAYGREVMTTVPAKKRVLVTAHDAFSYMGRDFNIKVVGIQGISTNSEAGLQRIEQLVKLLVENKVTAVFVESSVSERNIRALIEGAAAQGHKVTIGGELFSDAMGAPNTYEGTYIGMIDHNMTFIARALGGKAPAKGMLGKLSQDVNHSSSQLQ